MASYIHAGGKIGVLVEVNCESDFVARTDDFKELLHDIAMHIAASDPQIRPQGRRHAADFAREKEIFLAQAIASGKPAEHRGEDGRPERWRSSTRKSVCSSSLSSRTRPSPSAQLIASKIGKLGENIAVRRFARFKVGDAGETIAITKPTEPKAE